MSPAGERDRAHSCYGCHQRRASFDHGYGLVHTAKKQQFWLGRRNLVAGRGCGWIYCRGVAVGTGLAALGQIVVALLAAFWCLRLGLHIARRTSTAADDPRYKNLILQWGSSAPRRMFLFLQSQAVVGIILAFSILLAAHNPNPQWRIQDLVGLAVLTVAIVGEAIADRQLRAFKNDPGSHKAVCDIGLWRWSRHPNYFFNGCPGWPIQSLPSISPDVIHTDGSH